MVSTLAAPASRRRRRQHAVASALAGATLVGGRGYRRGLFGRPALRLDVSVVQQSRDVGLVPRVAGSRVVRRTTARSHAARATGRETGSLAHGNAVP